MIQGVKWYRELKKRTTLIIENQAPCEKTLDSHSTDRGNDKQQNLDP